MFDKLPAPQRAAARAVVRDGHVSGGVTLLIYSDHDVRRIAFEEIVKGFGRETADDNIKVTRHEVPGIGESCKAVAQDAHSGFFHDKSIDLVFRRCSAVVHIRFGGTSEIDDAVNYATRLDLRLRTAICE